MAVRVSTTLPFSERFVADGNWDASRKPITKVILHTVVGTLAGASARFAKVGQAASAHYGIGLDGSIVRWVEENNTAYHCGNYSVNQESIGIEHEDGGDYNGPRTPELYKTSSKLLAEICAFYSIPCDRTHVLGHKEVSINPTACPDSLELDRIVAGANGILTPPAPEPVFRVFDLASKQVGAYKVYANALNKLFIELDYQGYIQLEDGTIQKFDKPAPTPLPVPVEASVPPVTAPQTPAPVSTPFNFQEFILTLVVRFLTFLRGGG